MSGKQSVGYAKSRISKMADKKSVRYAKSRISKMSDKQNFGILLI